ncbi:hypothetical protein DUI87_13899 [Hirundo rustica rustica]|uniref:Myb-like domain-containing protein n=1 Tax=Hirundo rustica rustica TaxID=333673 RepID=A0A3M0K714_HIRRU|nr:hypothetical protein DUI87_13899 [Hirundo rustica rustica]
MVSNRTALALDHISDQLTQTRAVIYQIRLAVDYLLADEGGICGKFNSSECCLEIDDKSAVIKNISKEIRKLAYVGNQEWTPLMDTNWWNSFWSFKGDWWKNAGFMIICSITGLMFLPCLIPYLIRTITSTVQASIQIPKATSQKQTKMMVIESQGPEHENAKEIYEKFQKCRKIYFQEEEVAKVKDPDMKTDLNLLLECLKYQMDCPLSQKEALITIYSICQQNSEASEYFREIGGLMFINDLAKSSVHCMVKEAALFTLGIIIESNVYCQQTLCTSPLFEDLILFLIKKDSGVNLKRMSVYVILVLVSNNKDGQTYVRDTGCISLLLQLFRTTLSTSEKNLSDENTDPSYQLWSSVCSTLCACVNNPQNEDNQNICCSVFPYAKEWLESCAKPEIVRPICSFLGLTVANNSYVQKYFVSIGGLDTLAKVLLELMHDSCLSDSSMKLAVVVTKTLDACIANNSAMGVVLAKYHTVSELLKLLSNETLSTGEKISIILTIGHCTEVCEENQCELLQNNGLPLMIQVLTESQDEELIKAATFVLQNCKQMKMLVAPVKKDRLHKEIPAFRSKKDSFQSILLTPNIKDKSNTSERNEHSRNTRWTSNYNLTPASEKSLQKTQDANQKRQRVKEMCSQKCQRLKENCTHSLGEDEDNEMCPLAMSTRPLNKRRARKDFTTEEINCLLKGVQKMGNHWNLILWSYPFQKGRTSVDLSKKYYRLQVQVLITEFSTDSKCCEPSFHR